MMRSYRTSKGTELPLLNLRGKEYLEVKYRLVWFREDHPDWAIETELLAVNPDSAYARATVKDEHGRVIATSHKFESKKGFPDFIEKAETGAIGRALALIGYGTQFCADELDEGDRIVDAPVDHRSRAEPRAAASAPRTQSAPAARESEVEDDDDGGDVSVAAEVSANASSIASAAQGGGSGATTSSSPTSARDPGDYRIAFGKKYKGMKLKDIPRTELEGYLEWLEDNATKKGLPLSEEARFLKVAVGRFLNAQQPVTAKH